MTTAIYYFSASGHSLVVARDLAGKLNGRLISIPAVMQRQSIDTDAGVIGIVFPVYYASLGGSGIPLIVERFVRRLDHIEDSYIFAVCTHRGNPGSTLETLGGQIASRGGRLRAGFTVRASDPYPVAAKLRHFLFHTSLAPDAGMDPARYRELAHAWQEQLEAICRCVSARADGRIEARTRVAAIALAPFVALQKRVSVSRFRRLANSLEPSLDLLIPVADRSFRCAPSCNGCGICVRVCPANNIELISGRPVWRHRCETCFACFQWCPRAAICGDLTEYEKRYHHPDVRLADLLRRNGGEPDLGDGCAGGSNGAGRQGR